MPLLAPKDLSPEDRMIYRRWVGGLFATYGTILMLCVAFVGYKMMVAPTQTQAREEPADAIEPAPIRQAVKHD